MHRKQHRAGATPAFPGATVPLIWERNPQVICQRRLFLGRLLAGVGLAASTFLTVRAQERSELLTTALPYPEYRTLQDDHYGHHIGPVLLRYDASVSATFTDNRNYNVDGEEQSDFGLRPTINLGLFYPINERQKFQVDVGIGYQWWSNNSHNNRLYISPNSHLDYAFGLGDVEMRISNNTSTSSEASSRAEFAGGRDPLDVSFHRIVNSSGLSGTWRGSRRLTINGGYQFSISRSLNDQFTTLDRDTHSFNASGLVTITDPLKAGISGSYSMFTYSEGVQNDGQSYSVGPTLQWQPLDSLRLAGHLHYSESIHEQSGTIDDRSDFAGMTYGFSATHDINRAMVQTASITRSIDPGYGSNYTDDFSVRYGLSASLSSRLNSNCSFQYQQAGMSGSLGENADLYRFSVGLGYQVLRRANLGLTYSLNTRVSNLENRDYLENRFTLTASYQF
ncbi:MAG: hypothetical protein IT581_05380 [Verrucomicrobiales bacterium]|nr:hypothetical protein [Verrucomicrobiales bacterium]